MSYGFKRPILCLAIFLHDFSNAIQYWWGEFLHPDRKKRNAQQSKYEMEYIINQVQNIEYIKKRVEEISYINSRVGDIDYIKYKIDAIIKQESVYRNINFNPQDTSAKKILKEYQDVNFYILKRLKDLTDKLNIKFWLHGGTLLGAARHQGFIPWDDDMDIGMMRDDFETLKNNIDKDDEIAVDYFYIVPQYSSRQPRIILKGEYKPFFIDVFLYDECHSDNIEKSWINFCANKEKQIQELQSLNISSNERMQFDKVSDKKAVDEVFDKYRINYDKNNANAIIFDTDGASCLISSTKDNKNAFIRCFKKDFIFPLNSLKFNDVEFYVPKNYDEYLIKQYGDYLSLPSEIYFPHIANLNKEKILDIHKTYKEKITTNGIGYTAGAFDLFHIGHLNLLKRAKQNCNYLIAGVTTDELIEQTKGHKPAIPLEERIEIVKSCKYVDKVVVQDDLDKVKAWDKYHYDILFSGDDWAQSERWKNYEKELNSKGAKVQYFPYTKSTSSSAINNFLLKGGFVE